MKTVSALVALGLFVIGCGGAEDPAPQPPSEDIQRVTFTKIGNPTWEPVDHHQVSAPFGAAGDGEDFLPFLQSTLPAPDHAWSDEVGLIPGEAHPPPYDEELSESFAKLDAKAGPIFTTADVVLPNTYLTMYMVVPSSGSKEGSSPDFESGPIIPDELFPMHLEATLAKDGKIDPAYSGSGEVPPISEIVPEADAEGHSHFPMFSSRRLDPEAPLGEYVLTHTLTDSQGNGWKIEGRFVVKAE